MSLLFEAIVPSWNGLNYIEAGNYFIIHFTNQSKENLRITVETVDSGSKLAQSTEIPTDYLPRGFV
jgi:hypothetical protein